MESIIATYGYAAIFIGTFLEGETILIIAGFLSHNGYLHLPMVITAAFAGSFIGDQIYFMIGRYRGQKMLEKHPAWRTRADQFMQKLNRYTVVIILSFRFLYGLRTIAPFTIGLSDISGFRFFLLNLVSAVVWAISFGSAGYFFGHALEIVIGDIKKIEGAVICGIMVIALSIVLFRIIRKKLRARRQEQEKS